MNSNNLVYEDKNFGFKPKLHDKITSTNKKPDPQSRLPEVDIKKDHPLTYYVKNLV